MRQRVLTETECRYAQIEKEALGIVFGCEKFNEFVLGRRIIIETDHSPLISISKKGLSDIPPRLQRLFLRLLKYDYRLYFVPGKKLIVADTLSRIQGQCMSENCSKDLEIHATSVLEERVSRRTKQRLEDATARDPELQQVIKNLQATEPIKGVWKKHTNELSVVEGVLMKGTKVVIPSELRKEMLSRLHRGHLGMAKCISRARTLMYWPRMAADIRQMVEQCETCQIHAYKQPAEPLLLRDTPNQPWYRVGADLCEYAGKHYLVVYDAYSNYPEVEELHGTTTSEVINKLSRVFARYGIPHELCTDGGPQFTAKEFKNFAVMFDFEHIISSPYYPKSNGLAEKGVQIIKRLLKKAGSKEEFWLGLLNYRAAPLEDGVSPSQYLMGRNSRTPLPDLCLDSPRQLSNPRKHKQNMNTGQHLPPLHHGDTVRIWSGNKWGTKAKVLDLVAPRSYRVLTEDGSEFRKNRQDLRKTKYSSNSAPQQLHPTGLSNASEGSQSGLEGATDAKRAFMSVDLPLVTARLTAAAREQCAPPRQLEAPTESSPMVGPRAAEECLPPAPPRQAGVSGEDEPRASSSQQTTEKPAVQAPRGSAETAIEHRYNTSPRRSSRIRRPPHRLGYQN